MAGVDAPERDTSAPRPAIATCPFVSVVVPCRNEAGYIRRCLDSILAATYPPERLEVLVLDGMSNDGTRAIAEDYARRFPLVRLLDNARQTTPAALNLGIASARGSVIVRMDAHAEYPPTYILDLVTCLVASGADGVGGVCVTRPASDTPIARAIAASLSHPFGVGNSHFRIGIGAPRWVDTVPFGCYRRDVFDRFGWFDEDLRRNQDDEFNLRIAKHRGRLLLVPHVVSQYYARSSLDKLWQMFFQYGFFKPLVIRKLRQVMTVRQVVPALFLSFLAVAGSVGLWWESARLAFGVVLGSYFAVDLACAAAVGARLGWRVGLAVAVVFPTVHLAYGLGFLRGVYTFLLLRRAPPTPVLSR